MKEQQKILEHQLPKIHELYSKGHFLKEIAKQIGVSVYHLNTIEMSQLTRSTPYNIIPKHRQEITKLFIEGISIEEISKKYHYPIRIIKAVLKDIDAYTITNVRQLQDLFSLFRKDF